jgi:hypothetical protein
MRNAYLCAGALAAALALMPGGTHAQDGLAGMHTWVKVGRKTCMLDHFHDGSGTGKSRAQAERAAIQSWADFTAWEYSPIWGRFSNAVSRTVTCDRSSAGYTCNVSARPCRPY